MPYLDRALVELAARLPSGVKLRRFSKKYVLKRALRHHVPAEILRAKKRGFNVPVPSWLRGELREMMQDMLAPSALRRVGLFEPAYVERLIREHVGMEVDHSRPLWTLLMFMMWHEQWQQGRAKTRAATPTLAPSLAGIGEHAHRLS